MAKDKKCNGCKYLELTMAIDSYFATCNKGFFKNRKHISTLCYSPVDKPSKCKSFMSKNPKSLYVNFKPKKQQYIYVAKKKGYMLNNYYLSLTKMIPLNHRNERAKKSDVCIGFIVYGEDLKEYAKPPIRNAKLKVGEQKRIRILVDKAEVVK